MLIRALVVLLLVLNLGVALWWASRAPVPIAEPAIEADVARLQLVTETRSDQAVASAAGGPVKALQVEPSQCISFGPFVDAAAGEQAQVRLQSQLLGAKVRRVFTGTPNKWQVLLPPLPSKDEAQLAAERLLEAGFKDYYVVRDGAQTNAISLGLFGGESSARQHAANLVAAGFGARVTPLGAGPPEYWLDAAAGAEFDPASAQALIAATRAEPIDCADFGPDHPASLPTEDQTTP